MRRIFLVVLSAVLFSGSLGAQELPHTRVSPGGDLLTVEMARLKSATSSAWIDLSSYMPAQHMLTFTYVRQPGAVTVTLQCSNDAGATVASTIGTSTSTTGATIVGEAVCNAVRVVISGLTGSIDIKPVYRGSSWTTVSGVATEDTLADVLTALANILTELQGTLATSLASLPADPLGANNSAAITAGSAGDISGKLRTLSADAKRGADTMEQIRDSNTDVPVNSKAVNAGGCTWDSQISAGAVLEREVSATAAQGYVFNVGSLDATPVYLKLYNDTGANIDETDTPVARFMIPANGATAAGSTVTISVGSQFSTALTYRVTTGIADNDTGALTANEVLVNVCKKS